MPVVPSADRVNADIEVKILSTGSALMLSLGAVLGAMPEPPQGPQELAKRISVDKVLASRLLRAVHSSDEMSALHRFPGPAPLRRVLRGASKLGVDPTLIAEAERAIDGFDALIRNDLGDRGALDAIVAAWVPEARRNFELRSKQAAYRAMSQLRGVRADAILATAILAPSDDGEHIDIVWLSGIIGLQRLRPGAGVKLATRRFHAPESGRRPFGLDGRELDGLDDAVVVPFSSEPPPKVVVRRTGEVVQYTLGSDAFGPGSSQDLVVAEVNRREIKRYAQPGEHRKRFIFGEVSQPTDVIQVDAIVHQGVFPCASPSLVMYDTAMEGVADVNDRARDLDRLDMLESIERLGPTVERIGSSAIPMYGKLVHHALRELGWDPTVFRGYRCAIDYPVYGSQIAMCFDPPVDQRGE